QFRSGSQILLQPIPSFLKGGKVGQDQFGVDHLDVANGVNRATDMMNIRIFETTYDLHDGIDFANVAEKLITQTLAGARTFDQPGNIDELDRSRHNFLRP